MEPVAKRRKNPPPLPPTTGGDYVEDDGVKLSNFHRSSDFLSSLQCDPKDNIIAAVFKRKLAEKSAVRKDVMESMKRIFPKLSESSEECQSLVNIVTKAKVSPDDKSTERHDAVVVICNTLMKLFPTRAMFCLMQCCSRMGGNHFVRDAVNVVIVLTSQFRNMCMTQFLDKARTWEVRPPSRSNQLRRRKYFGVYYVRRNQKEWKYENIALKMDVMMKLMNTTMTGIEDLGFSRFIMNYGSQSDESNCHIHRWGSELIVAPVNTTEKEADNIANAVNKAIDNGRELDESPMKGFHMQSSFRIGLWSLVEHIDFGTVLVGLLFAPVILRKKLYPNLHNVDERYLAFLFQMTADCTTRLMYVTILAHLCICIVRVDDIPGHREFIEKCVQSPEDIATLAHERSNTFDLTTKANRIAFASNSFLRPYSRTSKFNGWDDEKKYQCIRSVIFSNYLKFNPQAELKQMVDRQRDDSPPARKKNAATTAKSTARNQLSTSPPSTKQKLVNTHPIILPSLSSQLMNTGDILI